MNTRLLILLDRILAPFLWGLVLPLYFRSFVFSLLGIKGNGVLIIKFLGAGNFLSLPRICNSPDFTFLTLSSNSMTINYFFPRAKVIYVSHRSLFLMGSTFALKYLMLIFMSFRRVVNLESDSTLSKVFSLVPFCKDVRGLSTDRKNLLDEVIYNKHIVVSGNSERGRLSGFLIDDFEALIEPYFKEEVSGNKSPIEAQLMKGPVSHGNRQYIVIAPTCSITDKNRRLGAKVWLSVIMLLQNVDSDFYVTFESEADPQFTLFKELEERFKNLTVNIMSYERFVETIRGSNGVITIDSQALHIAQYFGKEALCFFGPTSPYGINFGNKTTAISNQFHCSPCTHLYFNEPCAGKAPCQIYSDEKLSCEVTAFLSKITR